METLLFIRHGTSEFNLERRYGGRTDTPLSPQGIDEARRAALVASGLRIDCIVSSPLSRSRDTAQIIAVGIGLADTNVLLSELFVERGFGPLEGTPLGTAPEGGHIEGVESWAQLVERAWQANAWLSGLDAPHVLVCSHGVFGRALRSTFTGEELPPHPDAPAGIPNAVITCWRRRCACCAHEELRPVAP